MGISFSSLTSRATEVQNLEIPRNDLLTSSLLVSDRAGTRLLLYKVPFDFQVLTPRPELSLNSTPKQLSKVKM